MNNPEEPLINRNSRTSTATLRSLLMVLSLTVLSLSARQPLFAQSHENSDEKTNAAPLLNQPSSTDEGKSLTTVIDSSKQTLWKRLNESASGPANYGAISTVTSRASSATAPAPQGHTGEGRFSFTPYVWAAGLQGDVGAQGNVIHVDAPVSETIDEVNFGFAAVFEAQLAKNWILLVDFNYLNLSDDKPTPGRLFDSAQINIKSFFSSVEAGYNIANRSAVRFDLTGGVRVMHQGMKIELRRGASRLNIDQGATWVDPIVGFHMHAGGKVFAALKADIGGFGLASTLTWHIFGGGGVNLTKHMTLVAGYRYLDVDYRSKDFVYDTAMSGLLLGFGLRF